MVRPEKPIIEARTGGAAKCHRCPDYITHNELRIVVCLSTGYTEHYHIRCCTEWMSEITGVYESVGIAADQAATNKMLDKIASQPLVQEFKVDDAGFELEDKEG